MGSDDGPAIAVADLAGYCETQAGLLLGTAETIADELDALLDEIDEEAAEIRDRLDAGAEDAEGVERLEEKQLVAEAKRTRQQKVGELADEYADLAEELRTGVGDGREALDRVVRFEADADAPAYFPDRETVLEVAAGSDEE